mmetsp:Transcript_3895/g.6889  ORF Transcript_3895/g.6889 Transcript_3895/m.6889 type:complete len:221 (+) Transcript_3895:829-1491(+)
MTPIRLITFRMLAPWIARTSISNAPRPTNIIVIECGLTRIRLLPNTLLHLSARTCKLVIWIAPCPITVTIIVCSTIFVTSLHIVLEVVDIKRHPFISHVGRYKAQQIRQERTRAPTETVTKTILEACVYAVLPRIRQIPFSSVMAHTFFRSLGSLMWRYRLFWGFLRHAPNLDTMPRLLIHGSTIFAETTPKTSSEPDAVEFTICIRSAFRSAVTCSCRK